MLKKFIALTATQLAACSCLAAMKPVKAQMKLSVTAPSFAKGADYSKIASIVLKSDITSADIAKYIPPNMATTNNQGEVAAQVMDRSMSTYFASDDFRKTSIGHAAHAIENKMQQNVGFGGTETASTHHEFKFQMRAANARAFVDYTGFFNAQLSYQASNQATNFEVFENVAKQTKLVFDHAIRPSETRDIVGLRLAF